MLNCGDRGVGLSPPHMFKFEMRDSSPSSQHTEILTIMPVSIVYPDILTLKSMHYFLGLRYCL